MKNQIPLEIRNLSKHYDDLKAVDDVSIKLEAGEIFGLLGPNGAGKTSIISTIVTLEKPTSGSVEVFGYDVLTEDLQSRRSVGVVPQEVINHGFFDIAEILDFQSGYYGLTKNREQIEFLLHNLALWDHRHKKIRQLSGGMKRRLMIAKALVHKPKLLLLDEPTAGVDIELRANLWTFIEKLKKEGTTILLTTHYLEEAEQLCDRVGIIHKGRLLRIGDTKNLVKQFTQRRVVVQLKDKAEPMEFRMPATQAVGDVIAASGLDIKNIADLRVEEGRLEDAFRAVLGEKV